MIKYKNKSWKLIKLQVRKNVVSFTFRKPEGNVVTNWFCHLFYVDAKCCLTSSEPYKLMFKVLRKYIYLGSMKQVSSLVSDVI